MRKNLGTPDRLIRLVIGLILVVMSIIYKSPVSAIFGIFTLYEALASWCIFHTLIGRNTCPLPSSDPSRKIPLLKYYLTGISILVTAIVLNVLGTYLGWVSWYDILRSGTNLAQISLDNWLFLLLFYPLTLAIFAEKIFSLTSKDKPHKQALI